jgi:regulator of replication initiation timing
MTDEAIFDMLEELLKEIAALRQDMTGLVQDVHTILENLPMQMIPSDPDSEVQ